MLSGSRAFRQLLFFPTNWVTPRIFSVLLYCLGFKTQRSLVTPYTADMELIEVKAHDIRVFVASKTFCAAKEGDYRLVL